jgi:hypothetical protein
VNPPDTKIQALFDQATDLEPSDLLRQRIDSLTPNPAKRNFRWLYATGAAALLLTASLITTLTPRADAAGLLQQAGQNAANLPSLRCNSYAFRNGKWEPIGEYLTSGNCFRRSYNGKFSELQTRTARYRAIGKDRILMTKNGTLSNNLMGHDDIHLEGHIEFLKKMGWNPTVVWGSRIANEGRALKVVEITDSRKGDRETFWIDEVTKLPVRVVFSALLNGAWTPTLRSDISPGPAVESPEFQPNFPGQEIIDQDALANEWEKKLAKTTQILPLADNTQINVSELTRLANGDIILAYTGPSVSKARLVGQDGSTYYRIAFEPNDGRIEPRNARPLRPGGRDFHALWFTPANPEPTPKQVRVELFTHAMRKLGSFTLAPTSTNQPFPEWALAIDAYGLAHPMPYLSLEAKLRDVADWWRDPQGKKIEGSFKLGNELGSWFDFARNGLRRDPEAAREAIATLREMMADARSRGEDPNPQLFEFGWIPRLQKEADAR